MKKIIILGLVFLFICAGLSGCISENKLPNAEATALSLSGLSPFAVNFTGSGTDKDGEIVSWYWNFDDGNTSIEQNPSHTFIFEDFDTYSKEYNVKLTVTDDDDGISNDTIKITVYSNKRKIEPIADTYIDTYNNPSSNFAGSEYLKLERETVGNLYPFLLFDLSSIELPPNSVISSGTLSLYVYSKSEGIYEVTIYRETNNDTFIDNWTEGSLTYTKLFDANFLQAYTDQLTIISNNTWYHWNISKLQDKLTISKKLAVHLEDHDFEENEYIWFNSKDTDENKPRLEITLTSI